MTSIVDKNGVILERDHKSWLDWLPGLQTLRGYQISWLRNDLVAGIVLSTMLVPVGIAYAVASGLPAITGLYATIIPLLAYALVGPSRILVLGPDSSLAPIILGVVLPLSAGDPARAVAIAGAMAIDFVEHGAAWQPRQIGDSTQRKHDRTERTLRLS